MRWALLVVLLSVMGIGVIVVTRPKAIHAREDATAQIWVRPSQRVGQISPYIYGASVEWVENGNRIFDPQSNQIRPEIVNLLKPLRIPVWRFPGGILADYYHWRDGIGARDRRPKRENPMDKTVHENNFGTDEFIDFCRALNSEALITANFGTGSLDETLAWQKYWIDKGYPARYWEIGNEIYLSEPKKNASIPGNDERIYKTASEYASGFKQWAKALRQQDPKVEVGAIAGTYNTSRQNHDWLDVVLSQAAQDIDFVALHNSFAPLIMSRYDYRDEQKRREAYEGMMAQPRFAAEDIRNVQKRALGYRNPPPKVAITEHFPLFGGGAGSQEQLQMVLDQSRTLASALYTATLFHTYMREHVSLATYNLAVSKWFGALLTDTDAGLIRTPTYYVFELYRNHMVGQLVSCQVESPQHAVRQVGMVKAAGDVADLDAVAAVDPNGSINLAVVNRNLSQSIQAQLHVEGVPANAAPDIFTVTGPGANAVNGPSLTQSTMSGPKDAITLRQSTGNVGAQAYTFPAASATILRWSVAGVAPEKDNKKPSKRRSH